MTFKINGLSSAIAFAATLTAATSVQAEMSNSELQAEIAQLKSQISSLADSIEAPAQSDNGISIGGYGEVHANFYANGAKTTDKDGNVISRDNQIDFHRFVLFFGKEFNSTTRFFSELEVEHSLAGEGKPGEIELEQAYIEHDFSDMIQTKTGLFLVPVGIMNETHEPDTFYGVERNNVEKNIVPSTWWEAGAAVTLKPVTGVAVDLAVHSGLKLDAGEYKIRDGRQKVAKATANNPAYTARVKYTAIPGLEVAATAQYQADLSQQKTGNDVSATLLETHVVYQLSGFTAKALYAQWDIEGEINTIKDGADEQEGYYIEPAYRLNNVGVYTRYSAWDNTAGDNKDSQTRRKEVGVNYWLADTVTLKADLFTEDADGKEDLSGLNLGMGYSF